MPRPINKTQRKRQKNKKTTKKGGMNFFNKISSATSSGLNTVARETGLSSVSRATQIGNDMRRWGDELNTDKSYKMLKNIAALAFIDNDKWVNFLNDPAHSQVLTDDNKEEYEQVKERKESREYGSRAKSMLGYNKPPDAQQQPPTGGKKKRSMKKKK